MEIENNEDVQPRVSCLHRNMDNLLCAGCILGWLAVFCSIMSFVGKWITRTDSNGNVFFAIGMSVTAFLAFVSIGLCCLFCSQLGIQEVNPEEETEATSEETPQVNIIVA